MAFHRIELSGEELASLGLGYGRDHYVSAEASRDDGSGALLYELNWVEDRGVSSCLVYEESGSRTFVYRQPDARVWQPTDQFSLAEVAARTRRIHEAIAVYKPLGPGPWSVRAAPRPQDVARSNQLRRWIERTLMVGGYAVLLTVVLVLVFNST